MSIPILGSKGFDDVTKYVMEADILQLNNKLHCLKWHQCIEAVNYPGSSFQRVSFWFFWVHFRQRIRWYQYINDGPILAACWLGSTRKSHRPMMVRILGHKCKSSAVNVPWKRSESEKTANLSFKDIKSFLIPWTLSQLSTTHFWSDVTLLIKLNITVLGPVCLFQV